MRRVSVKKVHAEMRGSLREKCGFSRENTRERRGELRERGESAGKGAGKHGYE